MLVATVLLVVTVFGLELIDLSMHLDHVEAHDGVHHLLQGVSR